MKKYYKIMLTILEENKETNYDSLKIIKEPIIVRKTIGGNFKEIVTGYIFKPETYVRNDQVILVSVEKIVQDYKENKNNFRNHDIKEQGFYFVVEGEYFMYENPLAKYDDIVKYVNLFNDLSVSKYLKAITYEKEEKTKIKNFFKNRSIK